MQPGYVGTRILRQNGGLELFYEYNKIENWASWYTFTVRKCANLTGRKDGHTTSAILQYSILQVFV